MKLENINGIGLKYVEILNNLGIYSVDDLVRNYPYRFDVLKKCDINDKCNFDHFVSDGIIESNAIINFYKGKKNKLTFRCNIQDKIVKIIIFNRAFIKNNIKPGTVITVIGKYDPFLETITASNIFFKPLGNKIKIIPIYHLSKKISAKQMQKFINGSIDLLDIKK